MRSPSIFVSGQVFKGSWNKTKVALKVLMVEDGITPSSMVCYLFTPMLLILTLNCASLSVTRSRSVILNTMWARYLVTAIRYGQSFDIPIFFVSL